MIATLVQELQAKRPVHFFIGHPLHSICYIIMRFWIVLRPAPRADSWCVRPSCLWGRISKGQACRSFRGCRKRHQRGLHQTGVRPPKLILRSESFASTSPGTNEIYHLIWNLKTFFQRNDITHLWSIPNRQTPCFLFDHFLVARCSDQTSYRFIVHFLSF